MFQAQKWFALESSTVTEVATVETPAEKVLRLAKELPATRPQLESEAVRLEDLLNSLNQPATEVGNQLMVTLVEVLEAQLDGVYGLLDYDLTQDEELLQQSLSLLLDSDARLRQLENSLDEVREELPLVA